MKGSGDELHRIVAAELSRPVPAGARALAERLCAKYGASVRAILFYGSNLRRGDDREGLLDLYVLVDDYRKCYRRWSLTFANTVLPPNVFYLEVKTDDGVVVRSKYAVVTLAAFARGVSAATFESYFWARFAQPCALVVAADEATRAAVAEALATAVTTFVGHAVALCPPRFTARELWVRGLTETYRAELRSERAGVADALVDAVPQRYAAITRAAAARMALLRPLDGETFARGGEVPSRMRVRATWLLRRLQGKVLSLLRVLRNGLTFEGGIDYVLWKVARHSGVEVDTEWRQRRFRWLALLGQFWRLYRGGAFH